MKTTQFIMSCLLTLASTSLVCAAPTQGTTRDESSSSSSSSSSTGAFVVHDFDISKLGDLSYDIMHASKRSAANDSVSDTGIGYNWGCINTTGPDPLDCPPAIGQWQTLSTTGQPEQVAIPGGRCVSINHKSCMAFACAPRGDVTVSSLLVSSRLMNPAQTRCVVTGRGGVWANGLAGNSSSSSTTTLKVGLLINPFEDLPK